MYRGFIGTLKSVNHPALRRAYSTSFNSGRLHEPNCDLLHVNEDREDD